MQDAKIMKDYCSKFEWYMVRCHKWELEELVLEQFCLGFHEFVKDKLYRQNVVAFKEAIRIT